MMETGGRHTSWPTGLQRTTPNGTWTRIAGVSNAWYFSWPNTQGFSRSPGRRNCFIISLNQPYLLGKVKKIAVVAHSPCLSFLSFCLPDPLVTRPLFRWSQVTNSPAYQTTQTFGQFVQYARQKQDNHRSFCICVWGKYHDYRRVIVFMFSNSSSWKTYLITYFIIIGSSPWGFSDWVNITLQN